MTGPPAKFVFLSLGNSGFDWPLWSAVYVDKIPVFGRILGSYHLDMRLGSIRSCFLHQLGDILLDFLRHYIVVFCTAIRYLLRRGRRADLLMQKP
jgi:hypothetical protein